MSREKDKLSAGDVLRNLAKVLSEPEPGDTGKPQAGEEAFLERAMGIVDDWRRERILNKGREKQKRFSEFAQAVRGLLKSRINRTVASEVKHVNPALQGAFYRRLEKLSKQDAASAELEKELLRLWSEFCESSEGNESL
jgi:hypothetical protein